MQIALISSAAIPTPPPEGRYGGLERIVWSLAQGLAARGHQVALAAAPGSQTPPGGLLLPYAHGEDLLQRHRAVLTAADLVHDHGWELVSWAWALTHPGQPVVQTWHGPSLGPTARWHPAPAGVTVVGVSRAHAWRLSTELGTPVRPVYNGIDLDQYPLRADAVPDGPLLSLNRLDPVKGHHLARWAAAQGRRPLWIAGPATGVPDPAYVERLLRESDGAGLVYGGNLDEPAKVAALHAASCLLWLTPGYGEPFGLGVVEALACGVPVVAWHDGALPELLTPDCGVVVTHPAQLRDAIDHAVLLDPQRCRHRAEAFTADRMVAAYHALYEEVIPHGLSRRPTATG